MFTILLLALAIAIIAASSSLSSSQTIYHYPFTTWTQFTPITHTTAFVEPTVVPLRTSSSNSLPPAVLVLSTDTQGSKSEILWLLEFPNSVESTDLGTAKPTKISYTGAESSVNYPVSPPVFSFRIRSGAPVDLIAVAHDRLMIFMRSSSTTTPLERIYVSPEKLERNGLGRKDSQYFSPTFSNDGNRLYFVRRAGYSALDISNLLVTSPSASFTESWYLNISSEIISQMNLSSVVAENNNSYLLNSVNESILTNSSLFLSEVTEITSSNEITFTAVDVKNDTGYVFGVNSSTGQVNWFFDFPSVGHNPVNSNTGISTTSTTTTTTTLFPYTETANPSATIPTQEPEQYEQTFAPLPSPSSPTDTFYLFFGLTVAKIRVISSQRKSVSQTWRRWIGFSSAADAGINTNNDQNVVQGSLNSGDIVAPLLLVESNKRVYIQITNLQRGRGKLVALDSDTGVIISSIVLNVDNSFPTSSAYLQAPVSLFGGLGVLFAEGTSLIKIVGKDLDSIIGRNPILTGGLSFSVKDDSASAFATIVVSTNSGLNTSTIFSSLFISNIWSYENPVFSAGFSKVSFLSLPTTPVGSSSPITQFVCGALIQDSSGQYAGEIIGIESLPTNVRPTTTAASTPTLPSTPAPIQTTGPFASPADDGGLSGGVIAVIVIFSALAFFGLIIWYCLGGRQDARFSKSFTAAGRRGVARRRVVNVDDNEYENEEENGEFEEGEEDQEGYYDDDGNYYYYDTSAVDDEEETTENSNNNTYTATAAPAAKSSATAVVAPPKRNTYSSSAVSYSNNKKSKKSNRYNDDDDDDDGIQRGDWDDEGGDLVTSQQRKAVAAANRYGKPSAMSEIQRLEDLDSVL